MMNKKLFFGMFAAVSMLFATSCSQDELDVQSGNEAQVSFSLGLENGVQTRAISDGKSADMLVYAVFNSNGERISTIEQVSKTGVTFPTTESITLAKGQQYTVVFWAQDADCDAYTVSEDMKVTVDYDAEGGDNNDETRDAFFKAETFTVTGSTSINVVMKRPFAQINVGVTEEDWNAAVASGVEIAQSAVVIKNAATSINLIDGTVGEETTDVAVTYNPAAIPAETLEVDTDGDKVKESYKWLSMSYILPADHTTGYAKATLESLQFTFNPESGADIVFAEGLNAVPVQRNWRTNILGKILTGDIDFNISIDPIYDGDHNYPDGDAQALEMAATFGGEVTLTEDVVLTERLNIASDMVLNLNGHTISMNAPDQRGYNIVFYVKSGAELTIKGDGNVKAIGGNSVDMAVYVSGVLNIEGGNFFGQGQDGAGCDLIYAYGDDAVVNISGGKFEMASINNTSYAAPQYTCLNETGKSKIVVTGGTFVKFNPANNVSNGLNTNYVPEGYSAAKDGDNYVVVEGDIDAIAATADELVGALENGENVLLTGDIEINPANMSNAYGTTGLNVKNGQTIDGGGHTIDISGANGTWDSGINTTGGLIKNLTVTGSFRGIFVNHNSTHSEKVVLENVTIDGTTYTISCDQGTNQGLEATDCTFNGWTSYAATLGEATFVDCSFGEGEGYKFMRPYATSTYVNCDFCEGYTVDPRAAVTFVNCRVNGVSLTEANKATLVSANYLDNATVK